MKVQASVITQGVNELYDAKKILLFHEPQHKFI